MAFKGATLAELAILAASLSSSVAAALIDASPRPSDLDLPMERW
jgi:hypothetical protein